MVWRDQDRSGGGGGGQKNSGNCDGNQETETLLEPVTSPEVESVDGASVLLNVRPSSTTEEGEPLIENSVNSRLRNCSAPSSSRKNNHDNDFKNNLPSPTFTTKSGSSRGVPVMVTLDPTDRVSLNSGKYF